MRLPRVLTERMASTPSEEEQVASPSSAAAPAANTASPLGPSPAPMHADDIGGLRFNVAEPQGYFFPQVEEFVARAEATLRYWEDRDFRHQQVIHGLQVELDNETFSSQSLKNQIEIFKVNGSAMVNPDGSYVTESQQAAGGEHQRARVEELEARLREAVEAKAQAEQNVRALQEYADQQEAAYNELREWAEQAAPDLQAATSQAEALAQAQQTIATLLAENEMLRNGASQSAGEADVVLPVGQVAPADYLPTVPEQAVEAYDEDTAGDGYLDLLAEDGEEIHQPLPVMPVDTELPPGVTLPSQVSAEPQYPATAPGAPLTSAPDVPVHVWAPELNEHTQPIAAADDDPDSVPVPTLPERG